MAASRLPADDSADRLSGALPTAVPHHRTAPRRSSGDGVRSARCIIASSSSNPRLPTPFANLHATACAVLCGGHQKGTAPHALPIGPPAEDFAAPRNTPTRPLHLLAAARASALLAYATAHAGLCGTHKSNTHCCLHCSVGARVLPPAFCPRVHAFTLPRLRRRHGASHSPHSHARAVRHSLCATQHLPHHPSALASTNGCTHTSSSPAVLPLRAHRASTDVSRALRASGPPLPPLVARLHACCLQPLTLPHSPTHRRS